MATVYCGTIIHCESLQETDLKILPDHAVAVDSAGIIIQVGPVKDVMQTLSSKNISTTTVNYGKKFIMPGFIDTHIHAPQYPNSGMGTDLQLMDWLFKYTFPVERKYSDSKFAAAVYEKVIKRTLKYGSTTCVYFGTIHLEGCKALVEQIQKFGQRAFVGKVNMDCYSPEFYIEDTKQSVTDTEEFIKHVKSLGDSRVTPVITPRFVPTCSNNLMEELDRHLVFLG